MKTQKKFVAQHYLNESFFSFIRLNVDETYQKCYQHLRRNITGKICRATEDTLTGIIKTITIIKEQDNHDFLDTFIRPGPASLINETLITNYKNLKSLLIGLLFCHCITNLTELRCYKQQWQRYADAEDEDYLMLGDHKLLYEQFNEVKTMQEIKDFRIYFRSFIYEKLFDYARDSEYLIGQTLTKLDEIRDLKSFKKNLNNLLASFSKKLTRIN